MFPIVSIVGKSGAGKTTFLERLIPELKGRGYRIGVVKHSHAGFEPDRVGKDSWRLAQAGCDIVLLHSAQGLAIFLKADRELSLEELPRYIVEELDLLLTEGYKEGKATKIEIHRKEIGSLLCSPEELWAVVSDEPLHLPIPIFSWEDVKGLADLIEKTFLQPKRKPKVDLFVNGSPVRTNPFVQDVIAKTIIGMLSALRGVEGIEKVDIRLRL